MAAILLAGAILQGFQPALHAEGAGTDPATTVVAANVAAVHLSTTPEHSAWLLFGVVLFFVLNQPRRDRRA